MSCDCKPGTYEDGWREVRGPECRRIERDQFVEAVTRAATVLGVTIAFAEE